MVKKIEFITGFDINETFFGVQTVSAKGGKELADKINELICVVNKLHIEANDNARIRASHEKQIDELKTKDKPELTDEDLRNMMPDLVWQALIQAKQDLEIALTAIKEVAEACGCLMAALKSTGFESVAETFDKNIRKKLKQIEHKE